MTSINDADLSDHPKLDTIVSTNGDNTKKLVAETNVLPADSFSNLVNESLNHKALQGRIANTPKRSSSTAIDLYNEIRCTKEEELAKLVESQQKIIEELKQEVSQLKAKKNDDEERSNKKRKRDDLNDNNEEVLSNQVSELKEIIAKQNKELNEIREQLAEREYEHTENTTINQQNLPKAETETLMKNLETIIERKMNRIEERFVSIEEKLQLDMQKQKEIAAPSYSSALTKDIEKQIGKVNNPTPFREIMMNTRNEELAEEREKKARSCNIIIHGKCESNEDDDKAFIDELFKKLNLGTLKYKSIMRLGGLQKEKNRPIKLTMQNEQDKTLVLSKLRNLKNDERFHRIGITEDFTVSERLLIKGYHEKAATMNADEPDKENYIWRVRGSPKNGLFLKKTRKMNQAMDVQTEAV